LGGHLAMESRFDSQKGKPVFLYLKASWLALEPTQPLV